MPNVRYRNVSLGCTLLLNLCMHHVGRARPHTPDCQQVPNQSDVVSKTFIFGTAMFILFRANLASCKMKRGGRMLEIIVGDKDLIV